MTMTAAVIGLGDIARKAYLPVLSAWEGLELTICSRNPANVAQVQAQYRIQHGATRLEEVIDRRPRVAFILTPSVTHREVVEPFLRAGIDVFVEKPLTLSTEDSRFLAELADREKRVLMIGFNRRYAPLHRLARQLWGDRKVQLAVFQKHRSGAHHPDLHENYIDDTIHIIDTLRFFCGDGNAVFTTSQMENGKLTGAASTVAYDHGGYGMVLTSLRAGRWYESYALHGEGTSIFIEAFNRVVLATEGEQRFWEETYASAWQTTLKGRGFVDEVAHFFECVETRALPQTSGWEAYRTQQLLEDMVRVAKE